MAAVHVAASSASRSNHNSPGVYNSSGVYFFAGSVQEYREAKWVDFYMMIPPTIGIFGIIIFALVLIGWISSK